MKYKTPLNFARAIKRQLLGSEEQFSMANRMFNMVCFATVAVLLFYMGLNLALNLKKRLLICFIVILAECIFYYYARFRKKFKAGVVANGILSYLVLSVNYFTNSGIDGPTIFLFFFTLHILISGSAARWHIWWLLLHAIMVSGLLVAQNYLPRLAPYAYRSPLAHVVDIFATYTTTLLLMYIVTRHLRNYYLNEKYATEDIQIKLKAFFDSSSNYHLLLNRQKSLIYFNQAANQFVKAAYNKSLQLGHKPADYANPLRLGHFNENFAKAMEGNTVVEERNFNYPGITTFWLQITYLPARDNNGKVIAVSFNGVDITDRKAKQEKLHQKNQLLLKIAEIQSGGLREPVASLTRLMNLIGNDKLNTKEYLRLMEEATQQLDEKIHEIIAQTSGSTAAD